MTKPSQSIDPIVIDIYKVAVEMADRVSSRRANSNAFFLTVQTAFVAVLGVASPSVEKAQWWIVLAVSMAGIILSASWWLQLRSYRDLNNAKFNVINKVEEQLPVKLFTDEWATLKRDPIKGWRGRYAELGSVERIVPWVFAAIYVLLFIGKVAA